MAERDVSAPSQQASATRDLGQDRARDPRAILTRLAGRVGDYFPNLPVPPQLEVVGSPLEMDSSVVWQVSVAAGSRRERLAVKVFRAGPRRPYGVEAALHTQLETLKEAARVCERSPAFRSPRAFEILPDLNALVMEWVEGQRLLDWLATSFHASEATARACGEWLRHFHVLRAAGTGDAEITTRRHNIETVLAELGPKALAPAFAERVRAYVAGIGNELVGAAVPVCYSHGDFSASNVLVDREGRVAVLDISRGERPSPVEHDLASFLVSLEAAPLFPQRWSITRGRVARLQTAFLEAYFETRVARSSLLHLLEVFYLLKKLRYYHRHYRKRWLARAWATRFFARRIEEHLNWKQA